MDHKAIVFIERNGVPVPAGRLTISEDNRFSRSDFDYGRRYLQRPDAVALDPVQLPLTGDHLRTDEDFPIFNGIRDAAPDAWGRSLIDLYMMRAEGRPAMEAEYLLASQRGTRIGALQFGKTPEGPGQVIDIGLPNVSSDLGTLEGFQEMIDLYTTGQDVPDTLLDHIAPGSDLGGARPKGTVLIDDHPWLAKFSTPNDRINMAAAEAGCLDLCEMAGLETAGRRIVDIGDQEILLIKRFDRERGEDGMRRRHMISGLTLLGAHERDRAASGYADLYDGLRRYGDISGAGESLYRRMVMNVLVGNTDDHTRNHAFLMGDDGKYHASPVYDVTPSLAISETRNLFLHLGRAGDGREATLENAVNGAASLGMDRGRAVEIANELSDMVAANWRQVMSERGAGARDLDMMANSFSQAGTRIDPPAPARSRRDPFAAAETGTADTSADPGTPPTGTRETSEPDDP